MILVSCMIDACLGVEIFCFDILFPTFSLYVLAVSFFKKEGIIWNDCGRSIFLCNIFGFYAVLYRPKFCLTYSLCNY